jgi:hypothetical protein
MENLLLCQGGSAVPADHARPRQPGGAEHFFLKLRKLDWRNAFTTGDGCLREGQTFIDTYKPPPRMHPQRGYA